MPRPRIPSTENPFDRESLQPLVDAAIAAGGPDPFEALSVEGGDVLEPEVLPADAANNEPSRKFRKIGLPAWALGTALDLGGTYAALGRQGTREANPVWGGMSRGKLVGANAAISALIALALDQIAKRNDTAATVAGVGMGALRGGVGIRNFGQGQR